MYPEPYRGYGDYCSLPDGTVDVEAQHNRIHRGSLSIDLDTLTHDEEHSERDLETYFRSYVLPLAKEGADEENRRKLLGIPHKKVRRSMTSGKMTRRRSSNSRDVVQDENVNPMMITRERR